MNYTHKKTDSGGSLDYQISGTLKKISAFFRGFILCTPGLNLLTCPFRC